MIAEPLQWGHAVWTANLDDDDDDELIIGQRDPNKPGVAGLRGPGVFVSIPGRARSHLPSSGIPSTTAAWPAKMLWLRT